jgi:dTDP-4-dehydrorhamnose reductase
MKIIVFGSNGQLGQSLHDVYLSSNHKVYFFSKNDVDISNKKKLEEVISRISPDYIINAAAYTGVDQAELDQKNVNLVNYLSVKNISEISANKNIHLVHISTDYVFNGNKSDDYIESDITDPQTVYGLSKLKGEEAIIESKCSYTILRTSWVYSEYGNNFLKTMINLSGMKKLNIVADQYGCPTYSGDIACVIKKIIDCKNKNKVKGVFHYGGYKKTSWNEFAVYIFKEAYKIGLIKNIPKINNIESKDYPTLAKRPKNSSLNSSLICNLLGIKPSNWRRSVIISIKKISKNETKLNLENL